MKRPPFIYIAALRRSGSTVLSEALSGYPTSLVLREPRLGFGTLNLTRDDEARLLADGIDLARLLRPHSLESRLARRINRGGDLMLRRFAQHALPRLYERIGQVGVKEIRHAGWPAYRRFLDDIVVISIARDPRDIYLSISERAGRGEGRWSPEVTPEGVARHLNEEHRLIGLIKRQAPVCEVRYEDLCAQPDQVLRALREFVRSPLVDIGAIGGFNAANPSRQREHALHGTDVTTRRVERWKNVDDSRLVDHAHRVLELMPEYAAHWRYSAAGRAQ